MPSSAASLSHSRLYNNESLLSLPAILSSCCQAVTKTEAPDICCPKLSVSGKSASHLSRQVKGRRIFCPICTRQKIRRGVPLTDGMPGEKGEEEEEEEGKEVAVTFVWDHGGGAGDGGGGGAAAAEVHVCITRRDVSQTVALCRRQGCQELVADKGQTLF